MKKVVVTGASGYIGSRVVLELIVRGFDVVATARTPTESLSKELGVQVHKFDVLEPTNLPEAKGAACIIHCSTANDIISRNFKSGMDLSVSGTWKVMEFALSEEIPRFIYLSTFQVYGTELTGLINEETPVNCETPYGLNHWFGEEACRLFAKTYGLSVAVIRPANVYGHPCVSTVNRNTLVPMCFIKEAVQTGCIILRSSGRQRRNFISTKEVADVCIHLVNAMDDNFEIVNACSSLVCSMLEIAELTSTVSTVEFCRPLNLKVLSDQPKESNMFEADSKVRSFWPTREQAWAQMRKEISKMFLSAIQ